ncbi:hypothetical protein ScPMuIL_003387 [Solemya velum]
MQYELDDFPPALFDARKVLRKPDKPQLAHAIAAHANSVPEEVEHQQTQEPIEKPPPETEHFVLDGGSLLQHLSWNRGETFGSIAKTYAVFTSRSYPKATVVFNGYLDSPAIKDNTHLRRGKNVHPVVSFNQDTIFSGKKEDFLSRDCNKQKMIDLISQTLRDESFEVINAPGDADVEIVKSAVQSAVTRSTTLVGEDTDLLVLLLFYAKATDEDLYFRSDKAKASAPYHINELKTILGDELCSQLLFIHAYTGCDSTSRIFGVQKHVKGDTTLKACANTFVQTKQTAAEIENKGCQAMTVIYGGKATDSLASLRYRAFTKEVVSSQAFVTPERLPPTAAATKYHSMRVYYQIMVWVGQDNDMNACVEYGRDGEALVLECSGSTSSDAVAWFKAGSLIASSVFGVNPAYPHISWSYDLALGICQITIDPLIAIHVGEYRCTWTKGTANKETTYDVKLAVATTLGALTMRIDNVDPPVVWVAGQTKSVSCEGTDGEPAPTITLYRDGTVVKTGTTSVSASITLTTTPTLTKVLKCIAENVAAATEKTTTVTVKYPPTSEPLITIYSTGQILREGVPPATVTLTCTVGVADPEAAIEWGSNCPAGIDSSSTRSITRAIYVHRRINGVICTCAGSQSVTGWTGADSVTFTVYFGPDSVAISGNRGVHTGESLTLSCDSTDSNPGVTYLWMKNGVMLPGHLQQTLTLTYTKDDNMATITCAAANSGYPDITATGSVSLTVEYTPYATEITVTSDGRKNPPSIIEGREMTLTCYSIGNPSPSYTFSRGTGPTPVISIEETYTDANLTRTDSGQYTCTAANTRGTDSHTINVIVHYAPDVEITSLDLEVDSLSEINLSCKASGNPDQYTFHQWKHYGPHGDTEIRTLDGLDSGDKSNLTLPTPISYQDSGYYECAVDNRVPNLKGQLVQTERVVVRVLGPPIIPEHEAHRSAFLGERTTLKMEFYSVPGHTSVNWFYSQDSQSGDPKKVYITGGSQGVEERVIQIVYHGMAVDVLGHVAVLTLARITESQFRVYQVEVANVYGNATSSIELRGSAAPCTPGNGELIAEKVTQTSARIGWSASCNGGKSQTFIVEYKEAVEVNWTLFRELDEHSYNGTYTVHIMALNPNTVYNIRVRAGNVNGQSDYAHQSLKTSQIPQEACVCSEPTDAAIVGSVLGAVLVLVLLVVWVILWRRGLIHKETSQCCEDQTKEPADVYQNQVFQEEANETRDGVYQSIGPTENPNMHYERINREIINENIGICSNIRFKDNLTPI